MSEAQKTPVDVVLVKVEEQEEGEPKRSFIERIQDFDFADKNDQQIREDVLFRYHEKITDAGGPEKVEVLIARPFRKE